MLIINIISALIVFYSVLTILNSCPSTPARGTYHLFLLYTSFVAIILKVAAHMYASPSKKLWSLYRNRYCLLCLSLLEKEQIQDVKEAFVVSSTD
jgi:hypothetical protein